jgi:hypothetical protein
MKMVVLCAATLWVTAKNAPFSDRNKSFQTFLKTFEIASNKKTPFDGLTFFSSASGSIPGAEFFSCGKWQ